MMYEKYRAVDAYLVYPMNDNSQKEPRYVKVHSRKPAGLYRPEYIRTTNDNPIAT